MADTTTHITTSGGLISAAFIDNIRELETQQPGTEPESFAMPGTPPTPSRGALEDDIAAIHEFEPDLAIGTTPVVQKAKELAIPGLYFTNLISARPLMGMAGAGSLAQVVNTAIANRDRFRTMREFFDGVGSGHAAGVWQTTPVDRPEFRQRQRRKLNKLRAAGTRTQDID